MEQVLLKKLDGFRRRIRRMTFYFGFSLILSIVFGSMLLFGLLDWWFRIDSPNGRLAFASFDLLLLSISFWWFFVRPMRQGLSDLQLAFAIERHDPEFGESLVSTVQFLENRNRQSHDSPELKDRLVKETIRKLEQIELDRIVNTKPVRRIVLRAGMAIAFILAFALWNRSEAAIAMKRLFLPYGGYSWPKETQFLLLTAEIEPLFKNDETHLRKPKGDMLTVFVRNEKGLLPADTQLQIFYPEEDDLIIEETLKRVPREVGTGSVRYLGLIQIPVKQHQMQFRIMGGDDVTPWYTIDVVPPPKLEKFRLVIEPPAYTGKKSVTLSEGVGQLRAVLGTRVRIEARSNKKLNFARLVLRNEAPRNLILDPSGTKFRTEFLVRETGLYDWQIDLQDREGFRNPRNARFEIRAFEDRTPQIELLSPRPLRNRDEILATPNATIPVHIQANDDFGLKEIRLNYTRHHSEDSGKSLSLYKSGPKELSQEKKTMVYLWELSEASVVEGMLLGIHAEADDHYRDPFDRFLSESRSSRSKTRLLRIVTVDEKTNELLSHQEELIRKLEIQQKIQTDLVNHTSDLIIQLEQTRNWKSRRDYRQLTTLEKKQRAVASAILDEKDGLARKATTIKNEAIYNKLRDPVLEHSLSYIERELKSLSTLHLNRIDRQLIVVRKSVEDYLTTASPSRRNRFSIAIPRQIEHLKNARYHQRQVQAGLESLLAAFRRQRNLKDIAEELENILQQELEIARSTLETKRETFSKTNTELSPQQRADLFRLAEKQRRLSPRFGKLESELEDFLSVDTEIRQPRQLLRNLSREFADSHLKRKMQQASRELRTNKLGIAEETISEILGSLQTLVRAFAVKDNRDLFFLISQVKRIEREMASLQVKQKEYANQLRKLSSTDDAKLASWERKERQLLVDIEKISRLTRDWDAQQVADSFRHLQNSIQNTIDTLQSRNRNLSRRYLKESLSRFSTARDRLSRYRRSLEKKQQRELLLRIATNIADIRNRQLKLIQRTKQIHETLATAGRWTRPLSRKLFAIRDEEKKLQDETIVLSRTLKSAPAYEMMMKRVVVTLASIDKRLRQRQADEETIALQEKVVTILDDLLRALDIESPQNHLVEPPSEERNSQSHDESFVSTLAQLKLVLSIQKELRKKIIEIENGLQADRNISTEDRQELARMEERQKSLRDSMRVILSKSKKDDPQRNRLQQVVHDMQEVLKRITARNTGSGTQKLQNRIVTNLEILVRNLKKQQSHSASSQPDQKTSLTGGNSRTKTKQLNKTPKSGQSAGDPGRALKNKKVGATSPSQLSNLQSRIDERKKMIDTYWGHLPEAVKLRMLNQTDEKFLMQYREQIKRYFESLATDPGKKR